MSVGVRAENSIQTQGWDGRRRGNSPVQSLSVLGSAVTKCVIVRTTKGIPRVVLCCLFGSSDISCFGPSHRQRRAQVQSLKGQHNTEKEIYEARRSQLDAARAPLEAEVAAQKAERASLEQRYHVLAADAGLLNIQVLFLAC